MLRRVCSMLGLALVLVLTAASCDEPLALPLQVTDLVTDTPAAARSTTAFHPGAMGSIRGRVTWSGPIPTVPPFKAPLSTGSEGQDRTLRLWSNPHAPIVDPDHHGVANAVVFLRGVEPSRARRWDLAPVRVEIRKGQFHVRQGDSEAGAGFLRPGDPVALVSQEYWLEILQARGAAFFSVAFPETGPVRCRTPHQPGHVELISGAGHYWMRGHLFVTVHPYYTTTNADGQFTLPQVPPGKYQLVCWHPNWHAAGYERDIGTLYYTHLTYCPAAELVQPVRVECGGAVTLIFTLSASDFAASAE